MTGFTASSPKATFAANKKGTYLLDATAFSKGEPAAVLAEFVLTVLVS